jgi:Protein of unknown function (DUF2911)
MLRLTMVALLVAGMVHSCAGQQASAGGTTATCSFQDGKQLTVRYDDTISGKNGPPQGQVWTPGGTPMFLFTQSALSIGNAQIPIGAYSMYVIPQKENWTLILNKNVTESRKYDEHQDLSRVEMQVAKLDEPNKHFNLFFGHVSPKQCNMRIYFGKIGTWAEFREK